MQFLLRRGVLRTKKIYCVGVCSPSRRSSTIAERNVIQQSDSDFEEEQLKRPVLARLPLKVGCYKMNLENRFKAKLQFCSSYEAVNIIRKKLAKSRISLFEKSIFGCFLKFA